MNTQQQSAAKAVNIQNYTTYVEVEGTPKPPVILSIHLFLGALISFLAWTSMALGVSPQAQAAAEASSFVAKFNEVILYPTIALLSAVAFFVFLWGTAEYFFNATNDQARQQGVKHITYGIIGLVVMVSAFAILSIAAATVGLEQNLDCAANPTAPGCDALFTS